MTNAQHKARQGACEAMPPSPAGSRNVWYYAKCPVHGRSEHLSYIGGCVECAKAREQ
jgi:hypothetical protein